MEMTVNATQARRSSAIPMAIVAGLFFILGFATWLNGSLMPYLELVLTLSPFQASFIIFTFYIAVTVFAVPSAWVIQRVGYKNGMALGMLGMATAAFMFIPAAKTQWFGLFLLAQFTMGAGQTLLQTAVNPYVVKIGPEESAAARISIMGILNKSAGILAPMVFAALILGGMSDYSATAPTQAEIDALADNLILPYIGMGIFIGVLALAVRLSPLPELYLEQEGEAAESHKTSAAFRFPQLVLGVVALFFYVGVEVIAGDTIGSYGRSIGYKGFATLTSFTMTFMVIGYALGVVLIPRVISQQRALLASAVLGVILSLAVVFGDNGSTFFSSIILTPLGLPELPNTILFLAMLGFANAIMWPAIWPMALSGLGSYTSTGSALLIMAISGGAVLPVLMSGLAMFEGIGRQTAYIIMTPCYLYILFYAYKGHALRRWGR
jgi:FHS family L-fucose permease-like MFS transporter